MMFERLRIEWLTIGLILSLLAIALVHFKLLVRTDNLIYDAYLRSVPMVSRPDISIVAIDDASIAELGAWPWPRAVQARLLERLTQSHPKAVALDILFLDPGEPGGDEALAEAIARSSAPVFLPMMVRNSDDPARTRHATAAFPQPVLQNAAAGVGHVSFPVDQDGLVRRAFMQIPYAGRRWASLMALMAASPPDQPLSGNDQKKTGAGSSGRDTVLLSYVDRRSFTSVSANALLNGKVDPAVFRNKYVLVGVTATGVESKFSTPLGGQAGFMSGVEIQAHLLSGLLFGPLRYEAPDIWQYFASIAPLWILLGLFRLLSPRPAAVIGLVIVLLYLAASYFAFVALEVWVPQSAGLTSLFLAYPLWAWRRLAVVMAYMRDELVRFSLEPGLLALPARDATGFDPLTDQVRMLALTIQRAQDLRRFVSEAVHQLPSATLVIDTQGLVTLTNAAAYNLFAGQGKIAEAGCRFDELLTVFRPSDDDIQDVRGWLVEHGGQIREQVELVTCDGQYFEMAVGPYLDSNGQLSARIVQFLDVTPAKMASRQREEVLQLLTHDMRSPLVSILALLDRDEPEGKAFRQPAAIRRYTHRVLKLADDVVLLARAQAVEYAMEPVCLHSLLEDAAQELWPQCEAAGIAVDIEGLIEPQLINGDASLLARVFINLIGNAVKYAANGKRVLCRVEQHDFAGRSEICVRIRDWGPGIPAALFATIFDRFSRASTRATVPGVGLGMSFVYAVVRRHSGTIVCSNAPGGGAEFTLTFPISSDGAEGDQASARRSS